MQAASVLARAQGAMSLGIRYELGKGGMNPGSPTPGANGQCDCSGFVAWCFSMSRKTTEHFYVNFNNGWIETSAVWADIGSSAGIFEPIAKRPGAIIVFPDSNGSQGHIGILVDNTHVVHCSKGNDTATGNAIRVTSLSPFSSNNVRIGWLHGMT